MRRLLLILAAAGCNEPPPPPQIPIDQIVVSPNPALRTAPVIGTTNPNEVIARKKVEADAGPIYPGKGETVVASFVLVDAENRSTIDGNITLGGTLTGADQTAPLRRESLFVPAGGKRTFLLLDKGLAPRPWATGVEVVVTGGVGTPYRPGFEIEDVHQMTDGDRVVIAGSVRSTAKRRGLVIVHAAFHDEDGAPLSRGHALLKLAPGTPQTVRFVGPPGSVAATLFQGEAVY